LENQFAPHDLCEENHKRLVEARVQALLEAEGDNPLGKVRPRDIQKLIKSLKLRKACGIDGFPNERLGGLPRKPLLHLIFINPQPSVFEFSKVLEGRKNYNLTETW
jgi:hypothetical protein